MFRHLKISHIEMFASRDTSVAVKTAFVRPHITLPPTVVHTAVKVSADLLLTARLSNLRTDLLPVKDSTTSDYCYNQLGLRGARGESILPAGFQNFLLGY